MDANNYVERTLQASDARQRQVEAALYGDGTQSVTSSRTSNDARPQSASEQVAKGRHAMHELQKQLKSLSYNLSTSVVANGGQKYIEFTEAQPRSGHYLEVVDVV